MNEVVFGLLCYSLGLITAPIVAFVCLKLALRVLRRMVRK